MITIQEIRQRNANQAQRECYPHTTRVGELLEQVHAQQDIPQPLTDALCRMYEGMLEVEHGGSVSVQDYGDTFRGGSKGDYERLMMSDDPEDEAIIEDIEEKAIEGFTNVVVDMITTMTFKP